MMNTTSTATTTPMTIPLTLVDDFSGECCGTGDGTDDAPRFDAAAAVVSLVDPVAIVDDVIVGSRVLLVFELVGMLVESMVEEGVEEGMEEVVKAMVVEISLPFGEMKTPVLFRQQLGAFSQQ